jgi:hypothetical protein
MLIMRRLWQLRTAILVLLASGAGVTCDRAPSSGEVRQRLLGEYRLVLNSRSVNSWLRSSNITLAADGSMTMDCRYTDGSEEKLDGVWDYLGDGKMSFSRFQDCGQVFGVAQKPFHAVLTVQVNEHPLILLNPDIPGVFYERAR